MKNHEIIWRTMLLGTCFSLNLSSFCFAESYTCNTYAADGEKSWDVGVGTIVVNDNGATLVNWGKIGRNFGPFPVKRNYGQIVFAFRDGKPIILSPVGHGQFRYNYADSTAEQDEGGCARQP